MEVLLVQDVEVLDEKCLHVEGRKSGVNLLLFFWVFALFRFRVVEGRLVGDAAIDIANGEVGDQF